MDFRLDERTVTLACNGVAGLNVLNAWRPSDRHSVAALACFVAGWSTSELPLEAHIVDVKRAIWWVREHIAQFVTHGTNDSLVPVEQARLLASRLRAVSQAPVVYAELRGAQHAFDMFGSPRAHAAAEAAAAFRGFVYGQYLAHVATERRVVP